MCCFITLQSTDINKCNYKQYSWKTANTVCNWLKLSNWIKTTTHALNMDCFRAALKRLFLRSSLYEATWYYLSFFFNSNVHVLVRNNHVVQKRNRNNLLSFKLSLYAWCPWSHLYVCTLIKKDNNINHHYKDILYMWRSARGLYSSKLVF